MLLRVLLFVLAIFFVVALVLGVRKLQDIRKTRRLHRDEIINQQNAARRHRSARKHPLKTTMKTADDRPAYVQVRPTAGAEVRGSVLIELEEYVRRLRRKDIRRGLKVEYRNGKWNSKKDARLMAPGEKDT